MGENRRNVIESVPLSYSFNTNSLWVFLVLCVSEICNMDIHADVDYTSHDDPSLYVVGTVLLGSHPKYDR